MQRRLAEVAAYVGVSQATVSRVINEKPGISDATRSAVLTALDVLGYERPSKLRGERARLVGLFLPSLGNPVHPAFTESIAGALAKRGFSPVLCTRTADAFSEQHYVDILFGQSASGAIFIGGEFQYTDGKHSHYATLTERGLPAVLINAAAPGLAFPTVSIDDTHAIDLAYEHLSAFGHSQIGLMAGRPGHVPSARRLGGFAAARKRHGQTGQPLLTQTEFTAEEGRSAAVRLLSAGATALICTDPQLVIGAIRAARQLELTIPGDFSVIGFDDTPVLAHTSPALTTIRQPTDAMGQAAVALLAEQLDGSQPKSSELLFEPDLVVRRSTAPPR